MRTILIADDEANLRLLVAATIASEDYEVIEASDGDQAWDQILRHQPAVAILDVQMPGRTGLQIAEAVKPDPSLAQTQIVLLTSRARPTDIAIGRAAGANFYLTKPFQPTELLRTVEQALGGRRPGGPRL